MKERACKVVGRWWGSKPPPRIAGLFADNLAKCFCVMCGNPRRNAGGWGKKKTRQELKADLDLKEEIEYHLHTLMRPTRLKRKV